MKPSHNNGSRRTAALLCGLLLAICSGCQTFSLSEEDFQKQQLGQAADRRTAQAVETTATVGLFGAALGLFIAELLEK